MKLTTRVTRIMMSAMTVALLIAAMTGCETGPRAPHAGQPDAIPMGQYPNIAVEQGDLAEWLVFSPPTVIPGSESRPMSIVQPARNTANKRVNVQYRFEFFDEVGRPLNVSTGWRYMLMPSRIEVFFEAAALDTNAVDWRLVVKSAE